jgi:outer membrane protein assembly factor BamE (lipoprotein component of BamABCDE complex)
MLSLESREFWLIAIAVVLSIYGAFMLFSRWCLNSPAVPERKLNQLRVGMTQAEVSQLLGNPRRQSRRRDRPEWRYGHRLKDHLLRLRFDEAGRLRHFQHVIRSDPSNPEPD